MTIQQERQDAPERTNPFTVPTPQRVSADPPEKRMWIGVVLAAVLAVFTVLPNHGLTPQQTTKAPPAVVATTDH